MNDHIDIDEILNDFDQASREKIKHYSLTFKDYLNILRESPGLLIRDIFQLIYDMVHSYVPEGIDEYPDDPESVHYLKYDFYNLFIKESDSPFFADRLFANRFMNLIKSFNQVPDWNKIYFLEGPPGSGKSTFLKNFLDKFELYMKSDEGECYETCWKIEKSRFLDPGALLFSLDSPVLNNAKTSIGKDPQKEKQLLDFNNPVLEIHCPNHDHPILQIPKAYRKQFLYDVIADEKFKEKLFSQKKYEWIFKDEPCTICTSLYESMLEKLHSPLDVLSMLHPRRSRYNRRLGEGLSVYNPGDLLRKKPVTNLLIQNSLDNLFGDSGKVNYLHSNLAKTNNGIYVVMDIKNYNKDRLLNLHGIISDGIHKVENIEENIRTMFMGLINPQDKEFIEKTKSLKDRSLYIKMPYILDYKTEVQIYKNIRGEKLESLFLPLVLENFARIVIASRLEKESDNIKKWIGDSQKYSLICDSEFQLLKMDLYAGVIPEWIQEDDRRKFKAELRKNIINESEKEGISGFTGRESIHIFNEFLSINYKKDKHINMQMVYDFFTNQKKELLERLPDSFLDSLINLYDYSVLQQMKICIYSYSRSKISQNILDYIFGVNFDVGAIEKNKYTGKIIEVSDVFLSSIEDFLIGTKVSAETRLGYRDEILQKYISKTVNEISLEGKKIKETELYSNLYKKYVQNLKNNALDPFMANKNLRNAIKEFGTKEFKSHDKKIKRDSTYLIQSLIRKFNYDKEDAKEICIYVIDKDLASKFKDMTI